MLQHPFFLLSHRPVAFLSRLFSFFGICWKFVTNLLQSHPSSHQRRILLNRSGGWTSPVIVRAYTLAACMRYKVDMTTVIVCSSIKLLRLAAWAMYLKSKYSRLIYGARTHQIISELKYFTVHTADQKVFVELAKKRRFFSRQRALRQVNVIAFLPSTLFFPNELEVTFCKMGSKKSRMLSNRIQPMA